MITEVRPAAAATVVFLAAAAVLVMEILTARLMAPYLGVSLDTYTGIIGTVLAGIAAGSWLGGRAADSFPARLILGPILVLGGFLTLLSPTLVNLLGPQMEGGGIAAIVVLASFTVFLPALILSAVTPVVVKLQLKDLATTGTIVGRLSAFATAGALLGTFGTGFFLVKWAPTRVIVAATGLLLMVLGVLVAGWLKRGLGATTICALTAAAVGAGAAALAVTGPCNTESAYFCIRVIDDPPGSSGRLLMLDDVMHSHVDLQDPRQLKFSYATVTIAAVDTISPGDGAISVLQIGGGGFTMPRYLEATRPGSKIDVLELDQAVLDTARRELGLRTGPNLRVDVGDARLLVRKKLPRTYDFILGDAFASRSVPWHLTTREFLTTVRGLLRPGGAYIMNLIDSRELGFLKAEAATMLDVFASVTLLPVPNNFVLVGSDAPVDGRRVAERAARKGIRVAPKSGTELRRFAGAARPLRDDFAPVDQLLR
jgi:spermidine synthase